MTVAFVTLGCKVNQYETQAMERMLAERGHTIVASGTEADAYVVNTCSVTATGDQKSRQTVRRIRRSHPDAVVAVCGCYAQTHLEEARELDADLIAGTGDRKGFLELLEKAVKDRLRGLEAVDAPFERRIFEVLPAGGLLERTRAMLKVEDGCANFCSYCIIPYARGGVRSVSREEAAAEAKRLAAADYREIVITGIEISSWGRDLKTGETLIDLVEAVAEAAPKVRIRLGSLEPRTVTEDFCRRAAEISDLCPQFHLSLQSGCDETLRRMNRKYGTGRYLESVELLRTHFDRPAITTDLITGFPGETDGEFGATLDFIRSCGFARMHVFPYSRRPGTPAAEMQQVPKAVREERARLAAKVAGGMRRAYMEECIGRTFPVLFEQPRNGLFFGHAPNSMEVLTEGIGLHNEIRTVRINDIQDDALVGVIQDT